MFTILNYSACSPSTTSFQSNLSRWLSCRRCALLPSLSCRRSCLSSWAPWPSCPPSGARGSRRCPSRCARPPSTPTASPFQAWTTTPTSSSSGRPGTTASSSPPSTRGCSSSVRRTSTQTEEVRPRRRRFSDNTSETFFNDDWKETQRQSSELENRKVMLVWLWASVCVRP